MSEFVKVQRHNDVMVIILNNAPVNALSQRMVIPLQKHFEEAQKDSSIKAIVITGTGKFFVSGADIKEFSKPMKGVQINKWFDMVEESKKPVVIALNGIALGGGLELAMSGHYRISMAKTGRFGLVELKIGLLPGAGGTQRLPRLVGVKKATEMMFNGQEIKSEEALKHGLVDEVVNTNEELLTAAIYNARRLVGKELRRSLELSDKFGPLWQEEQLVANMLGKLDKAGKTRNQIHFKLTAECIITGILKGPKQGLKVEWNNFVKCLTHPVSRGLMNIFFAQRQCSNVPGITDNKNLQAQKVKYVAVIGGGTMGSGIITWLLSNGMRVLLKEINQKAIEAAKEKITGNFKMAVKMGKLHPAKIPHIMKLLKCVDTYEDFEKVDMVIEAVFEDIKLKQNTFIDLEKHTRKDCVLASNTSTISLDVIGAKTNCKERIIGVHFFAPAHVMPLVEVIRNDDTSDQTILSCVEFIKKFKKTVVVVKNCVGFLVNRVFGQVGSAGAFLVHCGVDLYRIDEAMYKFGMAMGPFRTGDLSGNDIGKHFTGILSAEYGDRLIQSTLVSKLVEAGRLGEKTGKGYYKYEKRKQMKDPELYPIIEESTKEFHQRYSNLPKKLEISDEDIANLLVFSLINESCRCLEEGIAIRPSDVDVAFVFGLGFPAYRGGVMHYGKTYGYHKVYEFLNSFYQKYNLEFFKPSEYLKKSKL
eukprot:gene3397-5942_t